MSDGEQFRDHQCVRERTIERVFSGLIGRLASDRMLTLEAATWARDRIQERAGLGHGPWTDRSVKVRMVHLARQYVAVEAATAELMAGAERRARSDHVQQAAVEVLRGLVEHPSWVCDSGRPSVAAARADIAKRAEYRRIDEERDNARFTGSEIVDESLFGSYVPDFLPNAFDEYVVTQLSRTDRVKWERFKHWVLEDVPQDELADQSGMTHEALRAELSRLARKLRGVLDGYPDAGARRRGDCESRLADPVSHRARATR